MTVQLICCSHSPLMTTDVEESEPDVHGQFFDQFGASVRRSACLQSRSGRGVRAGSFQRLLLRTDAVVLHRDLGGGHEGLASRKRSVAGAARSGHVLHSLPAIARFRRRDLASDEGRSRHHHSAVQADRRAGSLQRPAGLHQLRRRPASIVPTRARFWRSDRRISRRAGHAHHAGRLGRPVARSADAAARHEPARRGSPADRPRHADAGRTRCAREAASSRPRATL